VFVMWNTFYIFTNEVIFSLFFSFIFCFCSRKFVSVELMTVNKLDFESVSSFSQNLHDYAINYSKPHEKQSRFFSRGKGYFSVLAYNVCGFSWVQKPFLVRSRLWVGALHNVAYARGNALDSYTWYLPASGAADRIYRHSISHAARLSR